MVRFARAYRGQTPARLLRMHPDDPSRRNSDSLTGEEYRKAMSREGDDLCCNLRAATGRIEASDDRGAPH